VSDLQQKRTKVQLCISPQTQKIILGSNNIICRLIYFVQMAVNSLSLNVSLILEATTITGNESVNLSLFTQCLSAIDNYLEDGKDVIINQTLTCRDSLVSNDQTVGREHNLCYIMTKGMLIVKVAYMHNRPTATVPNPMALTIWVNTKYNDLTGTIRNKLIFLVERYLNNGELTFRLVENPRCTNSRVEVVTERQLLQSNQQ
jgi:hypothetical protein